MAKVEKNDEEKEVPPVGEDETDSDWTPTESDFTTDTEADYQKDSRSRFIAGVRKRIKGQKKSPKEIEREEWMPTKKEITEEAEALGVNRKQLRRYYESCGYGDLDYEKATDWRCIPIWRPEMYFNQKSARDARKRELKQFLPIDGMIDERVRLDDDYYDILMSWTETDRLMKIREFSGIYRQRDEESIYGNVFAQYDAEEAYKLHLDELTFRNLTTRVGKRSDAILKRYLDSVGGARINITGVDTSEEAMNTPSQNKGAPPSRTGTFQVGSTDTAETRRLDKTTREQLKKTKRHKNYDPSDGSRKDWFDKLVDSKNIQNETERQYANLRMVQPEETASEEELRAFVQQQILDDRKRFIEWKKLRTQGYAGDHPYFRSNPRGDTPDAGIEGWWSGEKGYKLPHQGLHGGIDATARGGRQNHNWSDNTAPDEDRIDDESDLPLYSYHLKLTMTPANWFILKKKFRASMTPGSEAFNDQAYRNWFEREFLIRMPLGMKQWFVRREEDLMTCHMFRTKMIDHASEQEFWRMGELRWNRQNFRPYIRVGLYVITPLGVSLIAYQCRGLSPWSSPEKAEATKYEFERWLAMIRSNEFDESYTMAYGQRLGLGIDSTVPSSYRKAAKFEDLEAMDRKSAVNQVRMVLAKDDYQSDFWREEMESDDSYFVRKYGRK